MRNRLSMLEGAIFMKENYKKRRKYRIMAACTLLSLLLLLVIGFRRRTILEGHADIPQWQEQTRFIPLPLRIENGEFELPRIEADRREIFGENNADIAGGNYLRSWNILPLENSSVPSVLPAPTTLPGSPYSVLITGGGGQHLILDGGTGALLFQDVQVSPGARMYYGFSHKSESERSGALDVYLHSDREAQMSIESDGEWRDIVHRYVVPDTDREIRLGFSARGRGSLVSLDRVWAKTGASLIVERSSDQDERDSLYPGETICYTITIRNYGQTAASELFIEDFFSGEVEWAGLGETQNLVVESVEREEESGKILFHIADGQYLEGIEAGEGRNTAKISYYVRTGNASSPPLRSQTGIKYNDKDYEHMEENLFGYRSYSNRHSTRIIQSPASSSVAVSLFWEGEDPDRPASVPVRLYRDGDPYSEMVWLSEENAWSHVWQVPGNEGTEPTEPESGSAASPSNANDSYADLFIPGALPESGGSSGGVPRWSVRQEERWSRYETREEMAAPDVWVITNTLRPGGNAPGSGGIEPQGFIPETDPSVPAPDPSVPTPDSSASETDSSIPETSLFVPGTEPETQPPRQGGREQGRTPGHRQHAEETRREERAQIEFTESLSEDPETAAGGTELKYEILVRNKGEGDAKGLWIRKYIPSYTHFSETDTGDYGCIDKKEHVTWFIPELAAGQEIRLRFKISKDYCVAGRIEGSLYYELLDSEEKPYANDRRNPANLY